MPHVLIAGQIHPAGTERLRSAPGVTFDYVEGAGPQEYLPLLDRADGLVIRTQPLDADSIAGAGRLRVVSRHGVGYDAVDVAALTARGIPLAIVGAVNARSVAEHAMMLMLAAAKEVLAMDRAMRAGHWRERSGYGGRELHGKRLLVIGLGRSGRLVAGFGAAFGMHVEAHDPFAAQGAVPLAPDLMAALAQADFVSIHAPKGEGTLLGTAEIAGMKRGAVLVNTARGGMVDEAALLAALDEGRIAAAGLDVFAAEPPEPGDPLLRHPRVILSPHLAGLSAESMERMAVVSVQNVLDAFAGRLDPALVVNREVLG